MHVILLWNVHFLNIKENY